MASICWSFSSQLISLALLICLLASDQAEADYDDDVGYYQSGLTSAAERVISNEYWGPAYRKIWIEGRPLLPNETYSLLLELDAIYEPFTDRQTGWRKKQVKKFIEVRNKEPSKCKRHRWHEMEWLPEIASFHPQTLAPYLEDAVKDLNNFCEEYLRSNLHSKVEHMSPESHEDIEALTEIFLQIYFRGAEYKPTARAIMLDSPDIVEGILLFLERKNGDLFTRKELVDSPELEKLFKQQVLQLCKSWTDIIDPIADYDEKDKLFKFNEREMRWLTYNGVCRLVQAQGESLTTKLFKQFKKDTVNQNKKGGILQKYVKNLNCLGHASATC